MKLTQKFIADFVLPAGKAEAIVFDEDIPGFGLRFGQKRKSWIVQWQIGSAQKRMTIGHTGILSAALAREEAKKILAKVKLGEDPQGEKLQRRNAAIMGELIPKYIAQKKAKNRSSNTLAEMQRYLNYANRFHGMPLASINRMELTDLFAALTTAKSALVADACRRYLSSFFSWAMRNGYAETNPVFLTERPYEPVVRERLLSAAEIKMIWLATDDEGDFSKIVRLLMLTGQRRQEIAGLTWSEIDLEKRLIRLPSSRVKNKAAHNVPLSATALRILETIERRTESAFVFGDRSTPFSGFSRAKRRLDGRISELQGQPVLEWRLHDLRRHADTTMRELGVNPWVVEALLNHLPQGVSRHYNFAQFEVARREALDLLAYYIHRVVNDDPAVALVS